VDLLNASASLSITPLPFFGTKTSNGLLKSNKPSDSFSEIP